MILGPFGKGLILTVNSSNPEPNPKGPKDRFRIVVM